MVEEEDVFVGSEETFVDELFPVVDEVEDAQELALGRGNLGRSRKEPVGVLVENNRGVFEVGFGVDGTEDGAGAGLAGLGKPGRGVVIGVFGEVDDVVGAGDKFAVWINESDVDYFGGNLTGEFEEFGDVVEVGIGLLE